MRGDESVRESDEKYSDFQCSSISIINKVLLSHNENPEPVSAQVRARIRQGANCINRYPFDIEKQVSAKLATHFGCTEEEFILVRGIDECFDRLSAEFPQMRYAFAWPGFNGYKGRILANRMKGFAIRLHEDFSLHEDDLAKLTTSDFVFIANPDNPTGRSLTAKEEELLRSRAGKLLIDETYIDYSAFRYRGLIFDNRQFVFRSFSKSYGLAGLRLGMVFGAPEIIRALKVKQWFCNVGTLDLYALEAAIENDQARAAHIEKTLSERTRMTAEMRRLGYQVLVSETNFILVKNNANNDIVNFLERNGVLVKDTSQFGLENYLRISIGVEAENDSLLALLTEYSTCRKRQSKFL